MDLNIDQNIVEIPVKDNSPEAGLIVFTNKNKQVNLFFASTRTGALARGNNTYCFTAPYPIDNKPYQLFNMKTGETILEGNLSVNPVVKKKEKPAVEEKPVEDKKKKKDEAKVENLTP